MKLTNISVVKDLTARHGFSFTKSLGQNFLINPSVCPKMAAVVEQPSVIEIGAGIGVLTQELSKTAKKVVVIEIDKTLKPVLEETLADCGGGNIEIIWGDVLKLDLREIISEKCSGTAEVVANLPYYAATHIIMELMEKILPLTSITVMIQEEVAQRFIALPGSKQYGIVSVAARFYSNPEMLFRVSRGSFFPAPNVDSAVIRLALKKNPEIANPEKQTEFFRLVKAAFSQRRKQLCNPVSKEFGADKEVIKSALANIGKDGSARAEELSLEEFIQLYENIGNRNVL
jgi:16S rRNA (adenine1518-N6/adenine1519-N6)-dimethyltransferase